jgi:hypothetical protein
MNNFEFEGIVQTILPTENHGNFNKKIVVITAEEKKGEKVFSHTLAFEAWNDKMALIEALEVNQKVKVSFNVKCNVWTNDSGVKSYFTSLVIWKLDKL